MFLLDFLDLSTDLRGKKTPGVDLSIGKQLLIYISIVAGVIASHWISAYEAGTALQLTVGFLIFAAITAFVLLPAAYQAFDKTKPILVQMALIFIIGMGWETGYSAAVGAVT